MNKYELGIVDTRNIIKTLQDVYNYDFKNYALTFFKRRVERVIVNHNLKDADGFIQKIETDKEFFEIFLQEMCVENTEMFRDPSLWRVLKEEIFPQVVKGAVNFKIWFPEVSSGEELYSTAIILKDLNLLNNVQLIASSISELDLGKTKEGLFDPKKIEVNDANFTRIFNDSELSNFYKHDEDKVYWDTTLIENTKFIKQSIIFDDYPKGVKLVLFRNQMIYYNQILQERFVKIIYNSLVPGGHLIIGNNEKIDYWNSEKDFTLINREESIYKKKLS
ncbi:CheR family methyltransferase [Bacteroidota bacterium]